MYSRRSDLLLSFALQHAVINKHKLFNVKISEKLFSVDKICHNLALSARSSSAWITSSRSPLFAIFHCITQNILICSQESRVSELTSTCSAADVPANLLALLRPFCSKTHFALRISAVSSRRDATTRHVGRAAICISQLSISRLQFLVRRSACRNTLIPSTPLRE